MGEGTTAGLRQSPTPIARESASSRSILPGRRLPDEGLHWCIAQPDKFREILLLQRIFHWRQRILSALSDCDRVGWYVFYGPPIHQDERSAAFTAHCRRSLSYSHIVILDHACLLPHSVSRRLSHGCWAAQLDSKPESFGNPEATHAACKPMDHRSLDW